MNINKETNGLGINILILIIKYNDFDVDYLNNQT
jgi:hypothetical protein